MRTRILDSDRNRPEQYRLPALASNEALDEQYGDVVREIYDNALEPQAVADLVHEAVLSGRFYVFTDDAFDDAIARRHREIEQGTDPTLTGHLLEEHLRSQNR